MTNKLTIDQLTHKANEIRKDIINMIEIAGSGHPGGSLGAADIVTALYFNIMNVDPKKPNWPKRDILMLGNGHIVPAQYAAMASRGYFNRDELTTLRKLGSRLQGHPERDKLPGLDSTSGPLGSGLSQAAGYAYSVQYLDDTKHRFVYVIMGDGELNEGNVWEAAMFASKYKLSQLVAIIDRNNIQIDGTTEDVMPLEDLRGKWETFGWHVLEIDGHNMSSIIDAVNAAKAVTNRPTVIIAYTIPGKGVDFMEYDYKWHGAAPDSEQAKVALDSLQALDVKSTLGGKL